MHKPKLRDGKSRKVQDLYPLGEFPNSVIYSISKWIIYNFAVGKPKISGEDWGDIFAKSIGGDHLSSPVGLADVVHKNQAWSVKSVKNSNPHNCKTIRIISGRNSPDFSYGIQNPHEDIQKTGEAVLRIWNECVAIALERFDYLRTCFLIRNTDSLEFTLFETETPRYTPQNFVWRINSRGNFEAFDKLTDKHKFTWQPHGSQFTIKYEVPFASVKFTLKHPPLLDFQKTMAQIGFTEEWVTIKEP